jgi:hypothetical protein
MYMSQSSVFGGVCGRIPDAGLSTEIPDLEFDVLELGMKDVSVLATQE